jgi:hypothetical protein
LAVTSGSKPNRFSFRSRPFSDVAANDFVTGFHIREVQIVEHVGERSEEFVADAVPEKEDAVRVVAHEARAVDHIGVAVEYGF